MRRGILWISIALNLAALAALFVFVQNRGGLEYLKSKAGIISPGVSQALSSADRFVQMAEYQRDAVFLGDSLTEGGPWNELFPKLKVANRGLSGDTVAGIGLRLEQVTVLKPRQIFLMVGINDLARSLPVEELVIRYLALVRKIKSEMPATKLTVLSIAPVNTNKFFLVKNATIAKGNDGIQKIARAESVPYIDIGSKLKGADGELRLEFTYDGIHFTGRAYEVWANSLGLER
ncbi:MAG: GDSL-type esterase/lipase family protein [Bdellovibrionia bacterium]